MAIVEYDIADASYNNIIISLYNKLPYKLSNNALSKFELLDVITPKDI